MAAWACRTRVNAACAELWNGASMGFALCPLLSEGAIGALAAHGERGAARDLSRQARRRRMDRHDEPDRAAGRLRPQRGARPAPNAGGDGTYRIFGQKIFITYGEHDMADNIVHLVLARLPDAPAGTRGISLFLVPKFLVEPDGSLGARNDVRCAAIEHKLGIHASPTCVMIYGDDGGADGWLVGEENRGLAAMFVMMNSRAPRRRRCKASAIAERAYQQRARLRARAPPGPRRRRRRGMSAIVEHPDVRRMLLTMKALVQAARGICHLTADGDRPLAARARRPKQRAAAGERAALLTPIAKAFSTDIGDEVASLGVQVHGGMGYIEETGAAAAHARRAHRRDLRRHQRHPGDRSRAAQAAAVGRRDASRARSPRCARPSPRSRRPARPEFGATAARLGEAVDALDRATRVSDARRSGADAPPRSPARRPISGCSAWRSAASASPRRGSRRAMRRRRRLERGRIGLARFFAEKLATAAPGLARAIVSGAGALAALRSDSGGGRMSEFVEVRRDGGGAASSHWRGRRRRTR